MAGLLDFLSTDEGRMGLGLLAAAGPRTDRMNTGGRIQLAMQGMDARKQEDLKDKLLGMQMKNYESEIDARKLAGVKDARQQKAIDDYYSNQGQSGGLLGSATSSGAFVPSIDGMGPTMPQQATQSQGGRIGSKTIDQIQEFKDRTGIDHLPAWKTANEGFERKPGTFVDIPGQPSRYIADPTKAIDFKDGKISLMPGAENIARLAGQTSLMTELPKAMLSAGGKLNLRDNADGTKSAVSEYSENPAFQDMLRSLGMPGGATQPAQTAPPSRPMLSVPGLSNGQNGPLPNDATNPGSFRAANPGMKISMASTPAELDRPQAMRDELYKAQQRLAGSTTPEDITRANVDIKDIQTQLRSLGGAPQQMVAQNTATPTRYGMTTDQVIANKAAEAKAVGTANADVVRDTSVQTKTRNAAETISSVDRAITLLGQKPTASLLGTLADKTAGAVGISTNGANVAAQLDVVAADVVKNVPRFEGPQSDKDVDQYKSAAGRLSDRSLPVDQRMAAAQEVKLLQSRAVGNNTGAKTIVKTGMYGGKKVVQYSDGSTGYAN